MVTAVPIYAGSERFYAPEFRVRVDGRDLPDPVIRDVTELTYSDNVVEIDSFEITLNNWDASVRAPKYEPAKSSELSGLFDPGKNLEISMGYVGNLRLMLKGQITTLEPRFPAASATTLSVSGLNILHQFRTEQHSWSWEDVTDSEIASQLGAWPLRKGRPGLGITVRTEPVEEPGEPYVFMDNQYDIVFLLHRARKRGYEVVLQVPDDGSEPYLSFGPSEGRKEPPIPHLLEWGRSLVSFEPSLSTATQIGEVIVRSWDRRRNRKIEGKAKWSDLVPRGPERDRMSLLATAFEGRTEVITNRPVHTKNQAKRMAKDILKHKLKTMVEASGSTIGLPDLRAGRTVQIAGLGSRFDGTYYVTETQHSIGDGGYTTSFKARRESGIQG